MWEAQAYGMESQTKYKEENELSMNSYFSLIPTLTQHEHLSHAPLPYPPPLFEFNFYCYDITLTERKLREKGFVVGHSTGLQSIITWNIIGTGA